MIQADLATSISHVTAAIDALPPPPSSDPTTEICTRIAALQHDLNQLVQGSSALAHLIQAKNREDRRFMEAIRATKPVFVPFEAKEEDEIKTWDSQVASPPPQIADALPLPAKPLRMTLDELRAHIEESVDSRHGPLSPLLTHLPRHRHKGREVPLNTPYDAKASLMTKALRSWGGIISDTVERMRTPVSKSVNQLVGQHFGASLKEELRSIASCVLPLTLCYEADVATAMQRDRRRSSRGFVRNGSSSSRRESQARPHTLHAKPALLCLDSGRRPR